MTDIEKLYNLYFKDVYGYTLALCKNKELAEDITQDTFLKVIKSIDKFDGKCKINVWMCQIAKNTYFSLIRKKDNQHNNELDAVTDDTDIQNLIEDKDDAKRIIKSLHKLPEPYKEVFTLHVFGKLSFKYISELFEKSESWARVTFYRAKEKIINQISEEEL